MLRFWWDTIRVGLVAAGLYAAIVEPMVLGSWVNFKIALGLVLALITWNAMRFGADNTASTEVAARSWLIALGTLGAISIVAGSQSWRPTLVVLAVGALISSARALLPTLRRVRIRLEEEQA